jgi:MFS family permease
MLKPERQAWLMVAVLFATLTFIFGGTIATPGVFFAPLIREFGWSHARVSSLASSLTLGLVPGSVIAGFLLEKVDLRVPIVAGAALTAGALLCLAASNSYLPLLISYFFVGIGVALSTLLPASMVVANWFREKRGIAMGVTIAGVAFGGMLMVQVVTAVIRLSGWRAAYVAIALPILLIVIPIVAFMIKARPPGHAPGSEGSEAARAAQLVASELEGFTLAEAVRTRSFWLVAAAGFLFAFTVYGILTQLVVYLLGVGYQPATAAIVLSLILGLNGVGKVVCGHVADRIGARLSLALSFALIAGGIILLFGSRATGVLAGFLLIYGPVWGAPLVLIPLITIESLGLKHYGSLAGFVRAADAAGAVLGPITLGRIFDVTKSYNPAFGLCIVCAVAGVAVTLGCRIFKPSEKIAIFAAPEARPASNF